MKKLANTNTTNGNVFLRHPFFVNKDGKELLPLSVIIRNKIITEVKFSYLSLLKKEVEIERFWGFLELTKYTQKKKILIIHDDNGIKLNFFHKNPLISIKFSNSDDYLKIGQDYDLESLMPVLLNDSEKHKFLVRIPKNNLKSVFWKEKN